MVKHQKELRSFILLPKRLAYWMATFNGRPVALRVLALIAAGSLDGRRDEWAPRMSEKKIKEACKMSAGAVHLAIQVLMDAKVIIRDKKTGRFKINQRSRQWKNAPREDLLTPVSGGTHTRERAALTPVSGGTHTRERGTHTRERGSYARAIEGYRGLGEVKPPLTPPPVGGTAGTRPADARAGSPGQTGNGAVAVTGQVNGVAGAGAGPYELKTDLQRLMCAYKLKRGVEPYDRAWDRANFSTWTRAAKKLLAAFEGRGGVNAAIDYLSAKADELAGKGLSWNLATIGRNAWDEGDR